MIFCQSRVGLASGIWAETLINELGGVAVIAGLIRAFAPVAGAGISAGGRRFVGKPKAEAFRKCGHDFAALVGRKAVDQKRNLFLNFKLIEFVGHAPLTRKRAQGSRRILQKWVANGRPLWHNED